MRFEIKIFAKEWGGACAVVLGDGFTAADGLKDAAGLIGSAFRPKQDGRLGKLFTVTMERPDGSRFNVHPERLKTAQSLAELEAPDPEPEPPPQPS